MKKLNYLFLGLAGLAMVSCSQEEVSSPAINGEGNVHFKVNLPKDLGTRAEIGLGTEATELVVLVYETSTSDTETTNKYLFTADNDGFTGTSLTTTVNMSLVPNKDYSILFFAASENALNGVYSIDEDTGAMTVDYTKVVATTSANPDEYDCFYAAYTVENMGTSSLTANVDLYRPIAQVNWGSTPVTDTNSNYGDVFGDNGEYLATTFTATNVPNTLDMFTGNVSVVGEDGSTTNEVTFTNFAPPTGDYPTIGDGTTTYNYLAMQYLLAPKATSLTLDLTLTITNKGDNNTDGDYSNEIPVSSAPIQANYQTNIYGNLLAPEATFTVNKMPGWANGSPYDIELGVKEPATAENDPNTYLITNLAELNWISQQSNDESLAADDVNRTFSGKTISIQNDIYMTGIWNPICGNSNKAFFKGTIQGNDKTIYNMTVDNVQYGGFVGCMYGQVENLNFENANVTCSHFAGVVAGYNSNNSASNYIKNCNVKNSTVTLDPNVIDPEDDTNGDKGGIIIGYMQTGIYMEGCSVENCTLTGYRDLGGLTGLTAGNTFTDCTINGLTINIDNSNNYKNYTNLSQHDVNAYYGEVMSTPTLTGCSATNVTINYDVEASQTALQASVGVENAVLTLQPLEEGYTLPNNVAKGVTFTGTKDVVFNVGSSQVANYSGVTFDGITFTADQEFKGLQHSSNLTYKNCTLNGTFFQYSNGLTFEDCTFNVTGNAYSVWTYGATNIAFTGCTFNSNGKSLLLYSQNYGTTIPVSVTNCTFTCTDNVSDKSAIMVNAGELNNPAVVFDLTIDNCKATGYTVNQYSESELWGLKTDPGFGLDIQAKVTVDGKVVYQNPAAEAGN